MNNDLVVFWIVSLSCVVGLTRTVTRLRSAGRGWMVVYLMILLIAVTGRLSNQSSMVYASAAMTVALIVAPGIISRWYLHFFLQQRFQAARRLARVIGWLHPADGWRQQPQIIRALELAQRGDLPAAIEILKRYQDMKAPFALAAIANIYRLTGRWEEFIAWQGLHTQQREGQSQFLQMALRARGETGDLRGLIDLYDRHRVEIGRLEPPVQRDICRLMLFAFLGKRDLVEQLFRGPLAVLPLSFQSFWSATADLAAGGREDAEGQLRKLLPEADPTLRSAIERRLSHPLVPAAEVLDARSESILEQAKSEQGQEERFGGRATLFSKGCRGTQVILALNIMLFLVEIKLGGSNDPSVLYRLGALYPPAVRAGQWWRLGAALFLHYGALHLSMNMLALWVLGPFSEYALGLRRFLLTYLLAGVGSMGVVLGFASGRGGMQMTVGASGSLMGLVGATAALMLRGWLRENALLARRRLSAMVLVVGMQTLFDAMVPNVSMAGHLSGAFIGFISTMLLHDRLGASRRPSDQPR